MNEPKSDAAGFKILKPYQKLKINAKNSEKDYKFSLCKLNLHAIALLILYNFNYVNAQDVPEIVCNPTSVNCPLSPMWQGVDQYVIEDEMDLWNTLCWYKTQNTSCDNPIQLDFLSNTVFDLSLLPPDAFPLEVSPGLHLVGDFNLGTVIPPDLRSGTQIIFPYTYERGWANYVINFNQICYEYDNQAAVFKLFDGSSISNVCLEGPKKDTKDLRYEIYNDACTNDPFAPHEGLCTGILVVGNNCSVSGCEIYGFPFAAVHVRDMIATALGNIVTPVDCYNSITEHGEFYFHHNYIHNNKAYGFGYGLWVSSGSGVDRCQLSSVPNCFPEQPDPPDVTVDDFWNYIRPEEDAFIYNNVFAENKHDIAATGNRTSLYIHDNTFADAGADYNINMHPSAGFTCNPVYDDGQGNDHYNKQYFTVVGGSVTKIYDNSFYRESQNLQLAYPNLNECTGASYPYETARIEVDQNFFYTPGVQTAQNGTDLDWATVGTLRDGYAKFELGGDPYFHYDYNFYGVAGDPHIQVGEFTGVQFHNICEPLPFTQTALIKSNVPHSIITSTPVGSGQPADDSNHQVELGEDIEFYTNWCGDADGVSPPSLDQLNIWNFNGEDGIDEVRTDNGNISTPVTVTFDHVGVNNVGLFSINLNGTSQQENRASNVCYRQITTYDPNGTIHFTFWIKDTYVGNELEIHPSLLTTSPYHHGVHGGGLGSTDSRPTGFVKYASINNTLLWVDDIEGDEGWQYVDIPIGTGQPEAELLTGQVEIGIMCLYDPETMLAPDAELIRGVTLFVDDIYIQGPNGENALANGDLETLRSVGTDPHSLIDDYPANWELIDEEGYLLDYGDICNGAFTHGSQSAFLTRWERHSGQFGFQGWIRPFTTAGDPLEASRRYNGPGVYKALRQEYDWNNPPRLAAPIEFSVSPNPLTSETSAAIICQDDSKLKKHLTILDIHGSVIFSDEFARATYHIKDKLKHGVYFIKIECEGICSVKKLVVIN